MGAGMNLSYLDNWWLGSKAKNYADFAKPGKAAQRQKMLADIATRRFYDGSNSDLFGAWASLDTPYKWINPQARKWPTG